MRIAVIIALFGILIIVVCESASGDPRQIRDTRASCDEARVSRYETSGTRQDSVMERAMEARMPSLRVEAARAFRLSEASAYVARGKDSLVSMLAIGFGLAAAGNLFCRRFR